MIGKHPYHRGSRTASGKLFPLFAAMALIFAIPARAGITFNVTFDSSVTGLSNAAQVEAAVNYVTQEYSSMYSNSITLNIDVVATPGTSVYGESSFGISSFTYTQIRNALIAHAKTSNDTAANSTIPASDPTGGGTFFVTSAQGKALGLIAPSPANDGTFIFGSGNNFTYDPAHRSVSGKFDFIGVVEHEFSEIMGRVPGLGTDFGNGNPGYLLYDLFRYSGPGTRSFTPGNGNYFSINSGATNLKAFYFPNGDGADPQDWASGTNDAYNAFSLQGAQNGISSVDMVVMDVIGYDLVASTVSTDTPTMPVWGLACLALLLFYASSRYLPSKQLCIAVNRNR